MNWLDLNLPLSCGKVVRWRLRNITPSEKHSGQTRAFLKKKVTPWEMNLLIPVVLLRHAFVSSKVEITSEFVFSPITCRNYRNIDKIKIKQNCESSIMVAGFVSSFTVISLCQINPKIKLGLTQNRLFSPKQHTTCQSPRLTNLPRERNYSGEVPHKSR